VVTEYVMCVQIFDLKPSRLEDSLTHLIIVRVDAFYFGDQATSLMLYAIQILNLLLHIGLKWPHPRFKLLGEVYLDVIFASV